MSAVIESKCGEQLEGHCQSATDQLSCGVCVRSLDFSMGVEEHPTKLSSWTLRELQLLDDPELATQVATLTLIHPYSSACHSLACFTHTQRPAYSGGVFFEWSTASHGCVIPILSSEPPSSLSARTHQRATQHTVRPYSNEPSSTLCCYTLNFQRAAYNTALLRALYNCKDHHCQHTAHCSSLTDLASGLGDDSTTEY